MKGEKLNIQLLIEGCLQANEGSQRRLYEYFYGYGMNICLRYARDKKEGEEILNDGFLRVFKSIDKYDPSYPFKPWLRRLLIASAIDYHRKYHKQSPFVELQEYHAIGSAIQPPSVQSDSSDIMLYIQRLPSMYRMVFNLFVMEGYKHHEIAEQLGISVGTSKSNLARAKAKLRQWLEKRKVKY
jgi:RNA polymerase sigma factor (sigma-70 family)